MPGDTHRLLPHEVQQFHASLWHGWLVSQMDLCGVGSATKAGACGDADEPDPLDVKIWKPRRQRLVALVPGVALDDRDARHVRSTSGQVEFRGVG